MEGCGTITDLKDSTVSQGYKESQEITLWSSKNQVLAKFQIITESVDWKTCKKIIIGLSYLGLFISSCDNIRTCKMTAQSRAFMGALCDEGEP